MKHATLAAAFILVLTCLATAPASGTTLSVTADAAIDGNFGMKILYDGNTNGVFVGDNTPESESTYNVEWRFNKNDVAMPDGTNQVVMLVRDDPVTQNQVRVIMSCRLGTCGPAQPGTLEFVVNVRKDPGEPGAGWRFCGRGGIGGGNKTFRFELVKGSGANDGVCRLFRNGVLLFERFDFPSDVLDIDGIRWGGLQPVDADITGFTKNDSFVSTR